MRCYLPEHRFQEGASGGNQVYAGNDSVKNNLVMSTFQQLIRSIHSEVPSFAQGIAQLGMEVGNHLGQSISDFIDELIGQTIDDNNNV